MGTFPEFRYFRPPPEKPHQEANHGLLVHRLTLNLSHAGWAVVNFFESKIKYLNESRTINVMFLGASDKILD